jgi:hypothetical protein
MTKIYKHYLGFDGGIIKIKNKFKRFLTVQAQNGTPTCWYEVHDNCDEIEVMVIAIGTGWNIPKEFSDCEYIGTAQDKLGYVWHYYANEVR